jgi:hypothetical protein
MINYDAHPRSSTFLLIRWLGTQGLPFRRPHLVNLNDGTPFFIITPHISLFYLFLEGPSRPIPALSFEDKFTHCLSGSVLDITVVRRRVIWMSIPCPPRCNTDPSFPSPRLDTSLHSVCISGTRLQYLRLAGLPGDGRE